MRGRCCERDGQEQENVGIFVVSARVESFAYPGVYSPHFAIQGSEVMLMP